MSKLTKVTCIQYGDYFINRDLVSFVSSGEINEEDGITSEQIFIHFIGGKESAMLFVDDKEKVISNLNSEQ